MMYHPQAYFVMFVSGEVIMYCMEWLRYEKEVPDFLHRRGAVIGSWKLVFSPGITVMRVSGLIVLIHPVLSLKIHGGYLHSFYIPSWYCA